MALVDLVVRVREALSVNSSYDAAIETGIKKTGERLLRDYNFPKQVKRQVFAAAGVGVKEFTLPAGFKKVLGVRFYQQENGEDFWSERLSRFDGFMLPIGKLMPSCWWLEGTKLLLDAGLPSASLDVVLWLQMQDWTGNADWLLADYEEALFYFSIVRLAPQFRKKEVLEVFSSLWQDERTSLAVYTNELEFDDLEMVMRTEVRYVRGGLSELSTGGGGSSGGALPPNEPVVFQMEAGDTLISMPLAFLEAGLQVFVNGDLIPDEDYYVPNNTQIIFNEPLSLACEVTVQTYG